MSCDKMDCDGGMTGKGASLLEEATQLELQLQEEGTGGQYASPNKRSRPKRTGVSPSTYSETKLAGCKSRNNNSSGTNQHKKKKNAPTKRAPPMKKKRFSERKYQRGWRRHAHALQSELRERQTAEAELTRVRQQREITAATPQHSPHLGLR